MYTTNMPKTSNFTNPSAQIARNNDTKLAFYHWTIVVCQPGGDGVIYYIWPDPAGGPGASCSKSPVKGNSVLYYLPGICNKNGKIGSQFPYRSALDDSNIIYTAYRQVRPTYTLELTSNTKLCLFMQTCLTCQTRQGACMNWVRLYRGLQTSIALP